MRAEPHFKSQRLSSVAHWDVQVALPNGNVLHLLTYHATTPVFDGPEDRNGLRNHDETMFWMRYLDGVLPATPPPGKFVILGDANLDPVDGEGRHQAINALLSGGYVRDPEPRSDYADMAALSQGGVNLTHRGQAALDTADWREENGPGNLRVDYVLPSPDLAIIGAGVTWPTPDDRSAISDQRGGDFTGHGLVWADISP